MNKQHKEVINSGSLIDLKAELLRKQNESKKGKSHQSSATKSKSKKSNIWDRSNAGVQQRADKDYEAKKEEEDVMEKARRTLQAKAKLYDTMTSGSIPDEDGSKRFLVDFERKGMDRLLEQRHEKLEREDKLAKDLIDKQEEDINKRLMQEKIPEPQDSEEQWVDYTDTLGRSRRCLKKDLSSLMAMDKNLTAGKLNSQSKPEKTEQTPDLMSEDMYRERQRQQWEKEELAALEGPAGPLHYSNVQFNEIRTHGVGFYQFDKEDTSRQEQMSMLDEMRDQTKDARAAHGRLKEKRKATMAARLAKVRQRKMIKEGKDPMELLDPSKDTDDSDDDTIGPKLNEKETKPTEPEPLVRDDIWRLTAPVREWDKGKEDMPDFPQRGRDFGGHDDWLNKLRNERLNEFAPPSMYKEHNSDKAGRFRKNLSPPKLCKPALTNITVRPDVGSRGSTEASVRAALSAIRAEVDEKVNIKASRTVPDEQISVKSKDPEADHPNVENIPLPPVSGREVSGQSNVGCQVPNSGQSTVGYHMPNSGQSTVGYQVPNSGQSTVGYQVPNSGQSNVGYQVPNSGQPNIGYQASYSMPPPHFNQYPANIPYPTNPSIHCDQLSSISYPIIPNVVDVENSSDSVLENARVSPAGGLPQPSVLRDSTSVAGGPTAAVIQPVVQDNNAISAPSTAAAPQPAHYSSGPMKPQVKKPRYERVNIHEVPLSLPVPPTVNNVPAYPSQEEVIAPRKKDDRPRKLANEHQSIKQWQRQFQYNPDESGSLKPDTIPFASPYIQNLNTDKTGDSKDSEVQFDPSKPPPNLTDKKE